MKPALVLALLLSGCASAPRPVQYTADEQLALLDRLTWGANASSAREMAQLGAERWVERQLKPPPGDDLPPQALAQIETMTIAQRPVYDIAVELAGRRRAVVAMSNDAQKQAEQRAFQQELTRLGREAATRSVLRALYSPWQLREQMAWFWMNHFSVFQFKLDVRATVGDYEERAIRPHALGKFRDLLGAVARHPAMLRYLDNAQNAAGRLNENYARELMELHTLGVDGGYGQKDVQELARVLTGFGIVTRESRRDAVRFPDKYIRDGLYEFNPARHDYGDKVVLGQPILARGPAELDEVLERLARHPSTARFVSRKLAVFFVADEPPAALVERMAATWLRTDGDIAAVLRVVIQSEELRGSLHKKFKDPVHYVYSALRLGYDDEVLSNPGQVLFWLGRMGQPLYGRPTPDGHPMTREAWASAAQMAARFEVARAIAYSKFERYEGAMQKTLAPATLKVLDTADTPREWNMLLLSSPEFMHR